MMTDSNEEKLSSLGEGPIDPEHDKEEALPTSDYERLRERMMRTSEADSPFPVVRDFSVWWIVAVGVLLALAIPIFYLAIGIGGGVLSNTSWGWFAGGAIVAILAIGVLTFWLSQMGARHRRLYRDDFGNRLVTPAPSDLDADRIELENDSGPLDSAPRPLEVRDVMRHDPIYCGSLDSIAEAATIMYATNVGFLIVLDENDVAAGVVTDRDLVCGGIAENLDPESTPVTLLMDREVKSVAPGQSIEDCLKLMQNEGVRRIPVLDQGRLIGIVSLDDLIAERRITIEDAAIVLKRQMSEPRPQYHKAA